MGTSVFGRLRTSCLLVAGAALVLYIGDAPPASAEQTTFADWQATYGPGTPWDSTSGATARCQLCHLQTGEPWNGYGWAIFLARGDLLRCDNNPMNGIVSNDEAFECVLLEDSDGEGNDNSDEIIADSQPGWTTGPNTIYFEDNTTDTVPAPDGLDPYDPDGAGGTAGGGGTGGTAGGGGTGGTAGGGGTGGTGGDCTPNHDPIPPGQFKRGTIVVKEGQSIQEAIDRAQEGTRIYVHAGEYSEPCNTTNGLNITKSGIHLIGQSNKKKRVVFKATNDQRNGIVVVPLEVQDEDQPQGRVVEERTDCMGCHTDLAPPFPLRPDVPLGFPADDDPWLYDITIEGITIEGFSRNGLFTEHVDGFEIRDVSSIDNRGYGIFPVWSKNGVITDSYARGSHDSGIWIETSVNVVATNNLVEGNVNGFEVSNSDDILLMNNEARENTVGAAILLLPDIFDSENGRESAKRINLVNNWFHHNNKENTAPGGILSEIPAGIGIFILGTDDGLIEGNLIEYNEYTGIAITDYCAVTSLTNFPCGVDPDTLNPKFLLDQAAENNRVVGNILVNNATKPPDPPFGDLSAEFTLGTLPASWLGLPGDDTPYHGNCYENNQNSSEPWVLEFFSLYDATVWQMGGPPPPWDLPACPAP